MNSLVNCINKNSFFFCWNSSTRIHFLKNSLYSNDIQLREELDPSQESSFGKKREVAKNQAL
ncbi:uncharacterized protein J3R85_010950 [Psidium guajava]|nr:uncharacterized protein J3R85_010950 [Psidium guajava]